MIFFYSPPKAFNFKINCVLYTVVPEIKREGKFTCKKQSNLLLDIVTDDSGGSR